MREFKNKLMNISSIPKIVNMQKIIMVIAIMTAIIMTDMMIDMMTDMMIIVTKNTMMLDRKNYEKSNYYFKNY